VEVNYVFRGGRKQADTVLVVQKSLQSSKVNKKYKNDLCPEMEVLDIKLTKESTLLLYHNTGGFLKKTKKTILPTLVLKIHTKKSAKQENSSLFMNSILWKGKMRVEHQTKT
jgi:hypothetical protein